MIQFFTNLLSIQKKVERYANSLLLRLPKESHGSSLYSDGTAISHKAVPFTCLMAWVTMQPIMIDC